MSALLHLDWRWITQLLDLGCGAGCLAILVSKHLPQRVTRIESLLHLPPYEAVN